MKKHSSSAQAGGLVLCALLALVVLFPALYTTMGSLMAPAEVYRCYAAALTGQEGRFARLQLLPQVVSLQSWYQVLLHQPGYLIKFWNSLGLCAAIVAGQLVISCMGGFAFAKFQFPGQNGLFFGLILLMMMPVQVTLVPNYILLGQLNLLNSWWALILPAALLPFGTFLMTQIFRSIPTELLDAARLDGAGAFRLLLRVMAPAGKSGVISLALLSFIDAWNMVEQPMTFLEDVQRYPLSVFLAAMNSQNFSLSFACGVLAMLPVLFLFLFFHEELAQGIEFSGLK